MKPAKLTFKSTALVTGMSLLAVSVLPANSAFAHDRHNPGIHGGYHLSKKEHRQFHRKWGRGNQGVNAYHSHKKRKSKKNNTDELIAAGIIGLAIGAIIASGSAKNKQKGSEYEYQPYPRTHYHGNGRYQYQGGYNDPYQPIPLTEYQGHSHVPGTPHNLVPSTPQSSGEPHVITFDETASLEPWTSGWREWCTKRYRSFNPQKGTFRGYDGLDHFCVPK